MNTKAFALLTNKDLQQFLNSVINRGINRSRLVSIAIGKALSGTYSVSPSDINFDDYFDSMFKINASIILNDLNETLLINIDEALLYTKKFLKFRYQALCGDEALKDMPFVLTRNNAILDILGVTQVFTEEESSLIKDEFYQLAGLVTGFKDVIKAINETEYNNG